MKDKVHFELHEEKRKFPLTLYKTRTYLRLYEKIKQSYSNTKLFRHAFTTVIHISPKGNQEWIRLTIGNLND